MISYGQRLLNQVALYAERNGELHVLIHEALRRLEALGEDPAVIHELTQKLHDVPQFRVDEPMRRGY